MQATIISNLFFFSFNSFFVKNCLMLVCILNLTLFLSIKANPMPIYHHLIHYV
jgi:hypothetical protein